VVLAFVLILALVGLALEQNWSKLMRVAAAAVVYLACMVLIARRSGPSVQGPRWRYFVIAGALAGLASGLLRTAGGARWIIADVVGAGLLVATVHWLAVHYGPRLRAWLAA
jgi:hypothetical protein